MVDKGNRGRIYHANHHHPKFNDKYMKDYD